MFRSSKLYKNELSGSRVVARRETRGFTGKHDEENRQKWQPSVPKTLATDGRLSN